MSDSTNATGRSPHRLDPSQDSDFGLSPVAVLPRNLADGLPSTAFPEPSAPSPGPVGPASISRETGFKTRRQKPNRLASFEKMAFLASVCHGANEVSFATARLAQAGFMIFSAAENNGTRWHFRRHSSAIDGFVRHVFPRFGGSPGPIFGLFGFVDFAVDAVTRSGPLALKELEKTTCVSCIGALDRPIVRKRLSKSVRDCRSVQTFLFVSVRPVVRACAVSIVPIVRTPQDVETIRTKATGDGSAQPRHVRWLNKSILNLFEEPGFVQFLFGKL